MPKGDKFLELSKYFMQCKESKMILSFNVIESILGFKLCDSAYRHAAYWYGSGHPITHSWSEEGFIISRLDLKNKTIEYSRLH